MRIVMNVIINREWQERKYTQAWKIYSFKVDRAKSARYKLWSIVLTTLYLLPYEIYIVRYIPWSLRWINCIAIFIFDFLRYRQCNIFKSVFQILFWRLATVSVMMCDTCFFDTYLSISAIVYLRGNLIYLQRFLFRWTCGWRRFLSTSWNFFVSLTEYSMYSGEAISRNKTS